MPDIIEFSRICKKYPNKAAFAVDDVSFSVKRGEILCLAGENGAGKSTLMKILYGMEQPSSGDLFIDGSKVQIASPLVASQLKIGMVHQHFMLVDDFSIAQNVTMGIEPRRSGLFVDARKAEQSVQARINEYGFLLKAGEKVSTLSVGQMQQTEILKMLYRDDEILILDEPTAVLTEGEIEGLFRNIKGLKAAGKTIILITHKLDEIKEISDRVAILTKGRLVGVFDTASITREEISRLMFGSEVVKAEPRKPYLGKKTPVLTCSCISVRKAKQENPLLSQVSFQARAGEILGFGGVSGNGLGVLEGVLGGFIKVSEGFVGHRGSDITNFSTRELRKIGFSYVPAKRITMGSCPQATVWENLISDNPEAYCKGPFLDGEKIRKRTQELIEEYHIDASAQTNAGALSGGNIQKMILAREMQIRTDCILFSEPTWGLDYASSSFVYRQIEKLRDSGVAVILISYNLDELLKLCDRIAILNRGTIISLFKNDGSVSRRKIGNLMLGME